MSSILSNVYLMTPVIFLGFFMFCSIGVSFFLKKNTRIKSLFGFFFFLSSLGSLYVTQHIYKEGSLKILNELFIFNQNTAVFMKLFLTALTLYYVVRFFEEDKEQSTYHMCSLLNLALGGWVLIHSYSFLSLIVGMEWVALSMYFIVSKSLQKKDLKKVIAINEISTGLLVLGGLFFIISMLVQIGHAKSLATLNVLSFGFLSEAGASFSDNLLAQIGTVFIFVSLVAKLGLFPFHSMKKIFFLGSKLSSLFLFSTALVILNLMILIKFSGVGLIKDQPTLKIFFQWIMGLSFFWCGLFCINSNSLREFMVFFATVITATLGLTHFAFIYDGSVNTGSLFYKVTVLYFFILTFLFIGWALIENLKGSEVFVEDLNGFWQIRKGPAFLIAIALLSLVGLPPFLGVFIHWLVMQEGLRLGFYWVILWYGLSNLLIMAAVLGILLRLLAGKNHPKIFMLWDKIEP